MARYRGAGTTVELGSNADPLTAVWTAIPQITNVRVQEDGGEIDVTDLGSVRKEYIQDLPDSANLTLTINYDPAAATHNEISGLLSLFDSGALRALRITGNGHTRRRIYVGFVMNAGISFEPTAVQQIEIGFRATGAPTYVAV